MNIFNTHMLLEKLNIKMDKKYIVAITGFAGSGKDTVGDLFVSDYGFEKDSFATPVKDLCASIFGWNREMLTGVTEESRVWRETVDDWWSKKLNIRNFTPRYAMQYIGTDLFRQKFNNDIWAISLEKRFLTTNKSVVLTDCRFENELSFVRKMGGIVIQINRGTKPDWWDYAVKVNVDKDHLYIRYLNDIEGLHSSEYSWIGFPPDYEIQNDASIADLHKKVRDIWQQMSLTILHK